MPDPGAHPWWEFGLWGTCGGAAVLAIDFWSVMRDRHGKPPVRFTRFWYWAGEACRILVGGVLAIALGRAQQVTVPLGAFTVGVAAPLILSRLGEYVPRLPPTGGDDAEGKPWASKPSTGEVIRMVARVATGTGPRGTTP